MSHSSEEEEEEEEEEDEAPVTRRRGSGFKMVTKVAPEVKQDMAGTMETKDANETVVTRIESHEVKIPEQPTPQPQVAPDAEEMAKKEAEARARAEQERREAEARQAQLKAQQEEAMRKAQQEALQRAQQAQEQAIKEAQERAQRDAQARAQRAQAEAKARQAQLEAQQKAQQEALRRAQQAKSDAQKSAQQKAREAGSEAAAQARAIYPGAADAKGQPQPRPEVPKSAEEARARREAQIKAEQARAEQLRAQQQAKMMAAEQARQAQLQAQKLQQNRQPETQQQRQKPQRQQPQVPAKPVQQVPQRQQPQVPAKQAQQVPAKQPQVPTKQQREPAQQPQPRGAGAAPKGQPAVPAKRGQGAVGGGAPQVQANQAAPPPSAAAPAQQQKPAVPLIPYSEEEIRVMRGGDVQQVYLSKLSKPQEPLPQQEVKAIHAQDDQSWVTQSRVPVEIRAPQPAKIAIPELQGAVEIKPTVIVPRPAQTTRVEWNEFPQEEVKEMGTVPRVKAGEWHPDNQGEIVGAQPVRSAYQPGRIGHVWPPPQNENVAERQEVRATKTTDDTAWIRGEKVEMEMGTAWGKAGPHNLREQRVWPPPENEVHVGGFPGARLPAVQWPPPEFEQQVQQDVEILQTRLPVKPNQRQWPPPPPEYRPVVEQNETVAEHRTQEMPAQKQQMLKTTTVTKKMVRAGGGR